jgi:DNA-binding NtrC family response regulator
VGVNPQTLLRSVRSAHLHGPGRDTAPDTPVPVLYVPAAARDRAVVRDKLARAGALVSLAADVPDALQMLGTKRFGLVVVDLATERTALATVRLIRAQFPATSVVGVIDPAQPLVASEAIYAGVSDLLPWPFDDRDVATIIAAARDTMAVDPSPGRADVADRLFEHSASMRLVAESMKLAAARRTAVLICGEPGSGRRLIARTLHERDHDYVNRPFVVVDCAAEGPNDLERRLFGVAADRPSETGKAGPAERATRASAVIAAQGGSLFLVNVIDAPGRVQARLARLLRDREVFSVDLGETIPLDVRPIGSVGPDVDAAVSDARLRRDLVERLGQVRIDVPPLRSRREDVPLLAAHFLRRACEAEGGGPRRFSRAALTLLAVLPWRGNAKELQDVVTATVRSTRHPVIQLEDVLEHARLDDAASAPAAAGLTLRDARARFERECISATLARHHGRVGDAARELGIQRTNLYRKVRQLNVSRALLSHRK